jgi:hypothetical protein
LTGPARLLALFGAAGHKLVIGDLVAQLSVARLDIAVAAHTVAVHVVVVALDGSVPLVVELEPRGRVVCVLGLYS